MVRGYGLRNHGFTEWWNNETTEEKCDVDDLFLRKFLYLCAPLQQSAVTGIFMPQCLIQKLNTMEQKLIKFTMSELNELQHCLDRVYRILGLTVRVSTQKYESMSKSELAAAAEVRRQQFSEWINRPEQVEAFRSMGVDIKRQRVLPPIAVAYICEHYGIVLWNYCPLLSANVR